MKFSALASLTFLASEAEARFGWGSCPNNNTYITNFSQERWEGNWYEILSDKFFPMGLGAECMTQNFKQRPDGNMEFFYRGKSLWRSDSYSGVGGQLQDCKRGSASTWTCKGTMNINPDGKRADWKVLATDYDRWAIMYNCFSKWYAHADFIHVMSRDQTLTDEELATIQKVIDKHMPGKQYNISVPGPHMYRTVQGPQCQYAPDQFDN